MILGKRVSVTVSPHISFAIQMQDSPTIFSNKLDFVAGEG